MGDLKQLLLIFDKNYMVTALGHDYLSLFWVKLQILWKLCNRRVILASLDPVNSDSELCVTLRERLRPVYNMYLPVIAFTKCRSYTERLL